MNIEHWTLLLASVLGLVHMAAASFAFKAQVGNAYTVGARDEDLSPTGVAARLARAQVNFLETYPIFASCTFLVSTMEASGAISVWGCGLYLTGRTLFLPLYAMGVPWLRTISWNIATLGLAMVGAAAFVSMI